MNQALVIHRPFSVGFIDVDMPSPERGELLLRVRYAGLCGTDLSTYRGKMPLVSYPRIPGHEIAASIIEKGADVPEYFRVGDSVSVNPYTACRQCSACRQKRFNACQFNQTLGVQRDGALRQYITVPYEKAFISTTADAKHLALTEPLSVAWHAVERAGVQPYETVLVMGCGMIGTGVILACLQKGARVIAMDSLQEKLDAVKQLGPIETIRSSNENNLSSLTNGTHSFDPEVVFETAGAKSTYEKALEFAAFGGRVVTVGYAPEPVLWDTSLIVRKELNILGSRNALDEFASVIPFLEKRSFDLNTLISKVFPFSHSAAALDYWHSHPEKVMKILIELP